MTETAPASISRVPFGERRTVTRLWNDAVSQDRTSPAYLVQSEDGWKPVSWRDAAEHVDDYANGLLALGVRKGDAFAILAQTTLEWTLFDLALAQIGAVSVPIYANSSPRDAAYVAGHSESVGILAEDAAQLAKVEEHRDELPRLEHALTYADLAGLATRGRAYAVRHPDALAQARDAVDEDDLFTILYTSGTTGPPKGCMISHRNEYAMVSVVDDLDDFTVEGDVMLLYLPLAHNFAVRPVLRLHDRVPSRSAADRRGAAGRPTDRLPQRAARLREGPHGCAGEVRRSHRVEAAARGLGARSGPRREPPAPRR
jgi:long-chain acyl-CoA synthetase